MAIDSEDKRRSIAGVPFIPDGAIDSAADRRHVAGLYRFGDADVPAPEIPPDTKNKLVLLGVSN